jgi:hypothetical protein
MRVGTALIAEHQGDGDGPGFEFIHGGILILLSQAVLKGCDLDPARGGDSCVPQTH